MKPFKVRYIGRDSVSLAKGKIYEVIEKDGSFYRIVDDTEEDYLFPPELFVKVNGNDEDDDEKDDE